MASIPGGYRIYHNPAVDDISRDIFDNYVHAYESRPFSMEITSPGDTLLPAVSDTRKDSGQELVSIVDITHNRHQDSFSESSYNPTSRLSKSYYRTEKF